MFFKLFFGLTSVHIITYFKFFYFEFSQVSQSFATHFSTNEVHLLLTGYC